MTEYHFTAYFENEALRKRPYLRKEWCIRIVEHPIREEAEENNRFRFRGVCPRLNRADTPAPRSPTSDGEMKHLFA